MAMAINFGQLQVTQCVSWSCFTHNPRGPDVFWLVNACFDSGFSSPCSVSDQIISGPFCRIKMPRIAVEKILALAILLNACFCECLPWPWGFEIQQRNYQSLLRNPSNLTFGAQKLAN